jgi:hypothetical protein
MTTHLYDVMLVRPDFYVYGGATGPDAAVGLIRQFMADTEQVGIKTRAPTVRSARATGGLHETRPL